MNKKSTQILIIILVLLIVIAGGITIWKVMQKKDDDTREAFQIQNEAENVLTAQIEKEKEIQIFKGNDRPIAVMIDNHNGAWPQAGLQDAYMVYEIIVEGGETRLMALFKGVNLDKIGPVRSARHYFIDYVMENDAIYTHFGWSPQAESDISKYSINNINGIVESSATFWRVKDKYAPHNAVTSTAALLKVAEAKGYRTTSTNESILNYVGKEVNLEKGISAEKITIPHSTLQTVEYEYDPVNKEYNRYARNKLQTDWDTGVELTTKNIIVTFCDSYTLNDSENKGRQGLYNIGTFDGYYITNGKAIKIKCIKEARNEQTVYQDLEGNEIKVNDGNTWVHICPINSSFEITGTEEPVTETNTVTQ